MTTKIDGSIYDDGWVDGYKEGLLEQLNFSGKPNPAAKEWSYFRGYLDGFREAINEVEQQLQKATKENRNEV